MSLKLISSEPVHDVVVSNSTEEIVTSKSKATEVNTATSPLIVTTGSSVTNHTSDYIDAITLIPAKVSYLGKCNDSSQCGGFLACLKIPDENQSNIEVKNYRGWCGCANFFYWDGSDCIHSGFTIYALPEFNGMTIMLLAFVGLIVVPYIIKLLVTLVTGGGKRRR